MKAEILLGKVLTDSRISEVGAGPDLFLKPVVKKMVETKSETSITTTRKKPDSTFKKVVRAGVAISSAVIAVDEFISLVTHGDLNHSVTAGVIDSVVSDIKNGTSSASENVGSVTIPTADGQMTISPEGGYTITPTAIATETLTPTPKDEETLTAPPPPEFIELNIISSVEFIDPQGLVNTSIKIDESMRMRPPGMSVDEIVINDSFPKNPENAMAQFSEHLVYKAAIKTNPEAANLTFEQFIEQWKKYKSGDVEAKKYVEFKVFDDATQTEISISPDKIEFVFGTASKLDGLHKYLKGQYDDGFRFEYHPDSNSLTMITGYSILSVDVDSYVYFANGISKFANLIAKYEGADLTSFNYTNIDEELRRYITSGSRVVFQIKRNGKPASATEAQQNP